MLTYRGLELVRLKPEPSDCAHVTFPGNNFSPEGQPGIEMFIAKATKSRKESKMQIAVSALMVKPMIDDQYCIYDYLN